MADHGDKNDVSGPRLEDCCSYNDQPGTTPEQAEIINLRHALNAATAEIDRLHDVTRSDDHTATDLGPAGNFTSHDYVTLARAIAFRELRLDRDVPPMTERDWDVIVSALCIATGYELNKMTRDIRARQRERK